MLPERRLLPAGLRHYVLCYALFAVIVALGYQSFWIWRTTVEVVVGYFYRKNEWFQFFYLCGTLLIGLLVFVVIAGAEGYLRQALDHANLADRMKHGPARRVIGRFARVAVPMLVSLLVAAALQEWIYKRNGL
jgi:hypothetical protein